jgi:hypothetical protein
MAKRETERDPLKGWQEILHLKVALNPENGPPLLVWYPPTMTLWSLIPPP